jgi:general stress protein 26
MVEQSSSLDDRQKVWSLIKDIRCALMVTHGADGKLSGRPMVAAQKTFEGELWFMTRDSTPKTRDVVADSHVLLAYSEPKDQNYVSVSGTADLVHDRSKIKELWSEPMRTWFPHGPDDEAICLIRVRVESAEYWDAPSSAWVYAYGYAKARLTGEAPHPGENKVVNF